MWFLILFAFVLHAVSYEYRKKPDNLLGTRTYDVFLFINGSVGLLLIGAAVGTFFTGSNFQLNDYHSVTWTDPLRGLEAAFNLFNVCLGLFLVFLARVLGAMYLTNNIVHPDLEPRLRRAALLNLVYSLPFLLYVLFRLVTMSGFSVDPTSGVVAMEKGKYLHNLLAMPVEGLGFLLAGLVLVIFGVGILRSFFNPERTRAILAGKREFLGDILAALLGIVTPFCSCSAVPLFIGFVEAGIPIGVTFAFLISAPMVNEIALVLLFGLFGFAVLRLLVSYLPIVYLIFAALMIAIGAVWLLPRLQGQLAVAAGKSPSGTCAASSTRSCGSSLLRTYVNTSS